MADYAPPPLRDAQRSLTENGYAVIEGALSGEMLTSVHETLYRVARFEREHRWAQSYDKSNDGDGSQRVWNLPSRDPVFCQLAEHGLALGLIRSLIGWPALLSSSSANIVYQPDDNLAVHADQTYMPEPWAAPHGINIAWCVDAFVAENGATLIKPKSHLLNRAWRDEDGMDGFVPVEAPAGSLIAMDGRLWHSVAPNRSGKPRAGIFNWYTLPIYMPQENWFLSLNPAVRQFGSEELLTLLGFRPDLLGRVNGQQPRGL